MAKSPYRPFTPKSEQMALMPKVSGNTINGLGETEHRKPSKVYWHDPATLAHGEMQKWFYTQNNDNQAINDAMSAGSPSRPRACMLRDAEAARSSSQIRRVISDLTSPGATTFTRMFDRA